MDKFPQGGGSMAVADILIVEDEAFVAESIRRQLTSLGYGVPAVATTGEEAIRKAEDLRPDLVLMDIDLGGKMDGVAAAQQIKNGINIPFVFLTAYGDDETIERAKVTEPFGYLIKPVEIRELRSTIEMALYKFQMEQKLREGEDRYRLLIESMNEGLVVTDEEGVLTYVNDKLCEMLGYTQDELMGQKEQLLTDEAGRQILKKQMRRRKKGEYEAYELTFVHTDGRRIPAIVSPKPVFGVEGQFKGSIAVVTDISERVRSERALQESRAELAAIFDHAPIMMILVDQDRKIRNINRTAINRVGYSTEAEIRLGEALRCVNALANPQGCGFSRACQKCIVRRTILDTLETGTKHYRVKATLQLEQDKEVEAQHFLISTTRLDTRAEPMVLVSIEDVTARVFIEDALTWEAGLNATIAELFKALIASVSIEEMSALILDHAKKLTDSESGFVGYIDPQTGHLICPMLAENIWNAGEASAKGFIFKEFKGLWGWVLQNRQSVLSNAVADDPRSSDAPAKSGPVQQIISVPALIQDTLLGQITLANPSRDYHEQDLILIERLASVYALAVQRHRSEENLRASEARLKAVFDFAGIAIALTDTAGRWIQCNQYWEQMMGYPSDELLTLSNHDITHPDDLAVTKECEADLLSGRLESYRIEKRYRHKRGYPIWVDVSVTPIKDKNDEIIALITAATDITQRKQAEDALQDSLQKLQIAYKQAQIYAEELAQDVSDRKRVESEIQQLNEELEQRVADRTRELSALYDVTAVASESLPLKSMLEQLLARVLVAMRTDMGHIHLLDETGETLYLAEQKGLPDDMAGQLASIPVGDGLTGWVFEQGEALLVPDISADTRAAHLTNRQNLAYVGVPMQARGRILGVLSVLGNKETLFNAEEVALLASVADQVGVAVENARLRRQAEHAAVVEERERLARELHDSVTQLLYSVTLFAGAGQRMARAGTLDDPESYLADLGDIAQQALKEMRLLVYELRPPALEQEGLIGALQHRLEAVEGRAGVEARLVVEHWGELPATIEVGLYRIAQEALNNALKHAAATAVTVRLDSDADWVELEVVDNGQGFDPDTISESGGMGLAGMQERIKRLNGSFNIQSVPGKGTTVTVKVKPDRNL